ncbi:MAG TPA: metal ABC transporter permease [Acidimicrobiales bacterium]|nr:metal ABC transporter permease [Acidimicrobiales bacterium]
MAAARVPGLVASLVLEPAVLHALLAGTLVAVASGFVGYLLVLRAQVFTGDALGHVGFTGALAAAATGVDLRLGLFAACAAVAVVLGLLERYGRPDDVVIGTVLSYVLGLGTLFLALYTSARSASGGATGVSVLFGSLLGLSLAQAALAAGVGAAVCVLLLAIARPLVFASLDEAVALSRGVPVRTLGLVFLLLVGVTAAEATQAVGALLLLGLLAAPAGAASRLCVRPFAALWCSAALALGATWGGLALAEAVPVLPPSFAILAVATASYLAARLRARRRAALSSRC